MLDTIVLTLPRDDFVVTDYDRFSPSARHLFCSPFVALKGKGNFRCVQNPSKVDLQRGIYKPRLTIMKGTVAGGYTLDLRIEFSAPKLLFGNNFDELDEGDFEAVLKTLNQRLHEMGVEVHKEALRPASVSAIHFSKNIVLKDYTTSSQVISAIAKLNLNSRLDLNKTTFRNEGHAVSFHANSYEVTFYDKIKDISQARISNKRAIENDAGFLMSCNLPRGLEVLRMEVRLNTRRKIKALAKKLSLSPLLTFQDVFSKFVAKAFLKYFWNQITSEATWLQFEKKRPEDILQEITRANIDISPSRALQLLGLIMACNSIGVRGIKSIFRQEVAKTIKRLSGSLNNIAEPCHNLVHFLQIKQKLEQFESFRLLD